MSDVGDDFERTHDTGPFDDQLMDRFGVVLISEYSKSLKCSRVKIKYANTFITEYYSNERRIFDGLGIQQDIWRIAKLLSGRE